MTLLFLFFIINGNGTTEIKEKVSEQTEMGSVQQTDEWEGV